MAQSQYDPIPDLAALIDGLTRIAEGNRENLFRELSILSSPYVRLRGGLLLDEPSRANLNTEISLISALEDYGWRVMR